MSHGDQTYHLEHEYSKGESSRGAVQVRPQRQHDNRISGATWAVACLVNTAVMRTADLDAMHFGTPQQHPDVDRQQACAVPCKHLITAKCAEAWGTQG
jgi:hypothetical protein